MNSASTRLQPRLDFRDGFNIAGDDILKAVIEDCVIADLRKALGAAGVPEADVKAVAVEVLGRDVLGKSQEVRNRRGQLARQVLVPIGLGLLADYEKTDIRRPVTVTTRPLGDYLGTENHPSSEVVAYFEQAVRRAGAPEFRLLDVPIHSNPLAVDRAVRRVIGQVLADLCEVVHLYDCDLLLVTGRPSRWPAVQSAIYAKLPVAPDRVVPMHDFRIGSWYPFSDYRGRIPDPKTTVVVGGILCALAEGHLEGFSLDVAALKLESTARYIGEVGNDGQIRKARVWFDIDLNAKNEVELMRSVTFANPVTIGFRQLPVERWTTTRLYHVDFASPDARSNAQGRLPYTLKMAYRLAEVEADATEGRARRRTGHRGHHRRRWRPGPPRRHRSAACRPFPPRRATGSTPAFSPSSEQDAMTNEDQQLAETCRTGIDWVGKAVSWVGDNREMVRGECDGIVADLHKQRRQLAKLERAARRKMCVGVFGPSQSGKSYLISALARSGNDLLADFGDRKPDFVSEINPEGGKESTGLVTRFTLTRPESTPAGFPVRLRLLSETDIVRIIGNSYYEDFLHKGKIEPEPVRALLAELGTATGRPSAVSADDAADLQEYFLNNYGHLARMEMLQTNYWPQATKLAAALPAADRARLFAPIWNGAERFTQLFRELQAALEKIGFAGEVYCPIDALIPREKSIIDVATLAGLGAAGSDTIEVQTADGRRAALPRPVVAALTAEITIVMVNKPDDFFDHTDLLDFPGYRSRKRHSDIDQALADDSIFYELFLRGKVAYLFERYCDERELTSMVLCIGPGPQEVQSLPQVIDRWVRGTHGESADRRGTAAKALFFVLTKFDMEFSKKKGAADSNELRWSQRIEASLTSFFGSCGDWVDNWAPAKPFDNLFWVRNPNVKAEAVFEYDGTGEKALREDQREFVVELEQGFLRNPLVTRHFARPKQAWDAAMKLNDGGVGYLRDCLRPLCNPELKRRQIQGSLAELSTRIGTRLSPYHKTDDKDAERRAKEILAKTLAGRLAGCVQNQRFAELIRLLQVADHELYDIVFAADLAVAEQEEDGSAHAMPAVIGVGVAADDIMADLFGAEAPPPTESAAAPQLRDEAALLAQAIEKHWIAKARNVADDIDLQRWFALAGPEFGALVHELVLGASRLQIFTAVADAIRTASRFRNITRDRLVWKQVSGAAVMINAWVDWLGFDPRRLPADQRTVSVAGRTLSVFREVAPVTGLPPLGENQLPYDVQYYKDWIAAFVHTVARNVDFDGASTVDPEQNRRLGAVLAAFAATQGAVP